MLDLTVNYILPNVALFGGIYFLSKGLEKLTWDFILWYNENY